MSEPKMWVVDELLPAGIIFKLAAQVRENPEYDPSKTIKILTEEYDYLINKEELYRIKAEAWDEGYDARHTEKNPYRRKNE